MNSEKSGPFHPEELKENSPLQEQNAENDPKKEKLKKLAAGYISFGNEKGISKALELLDGFEDGLSKKERKEIIEEGVKKGLHRALEQLNLSKIAGLLELRSTVSKPEPDFLSQFKENFVAGCERFFEEEKRSQAIKVVDFLEIYNLLSKQNSDTKFFSSQETKEAIQKRFAFEMNGLSWKNDEELEALLKLNEIMDELKITANLEKKEEIEKSVEKKLPLLFDTENSDRLEKILALTKKQGLTIKSNALFPLLLELFETGKNTADAAKKIEAFSAAGLTNNLSDLTRAVVSARNSTANLKPEFFGYLKQSESRSELKKILNENLENFILNGQFENASVVLRHLGDQVEKTEINLDNLFTAASQKFAETKSFTDLRALSFFYGKISGVDFTRINQELKTTLREFGLNKMAADIFNIQTLVCLDQDLLKRLQLPFYANEAMINFVKNVVHQYPSQIKNTLDQIERLENLDLGADLPLAEKILTRLGVFSANFLLSCQEIGNPAEIDAFLRSVKRLSTQLFQNQSLEPEKYDFDEKIFQKIIADIVYAAYKPVGMSVEEVENWLHKLEDHTDHLDEYAFPKTGYELDLIMEREEKELKAGEKLDPALFKALETLTARPTDKKTRTEAVKKMLIKISKAATTFDLNDLAKLFLVLPDEVFSRIAKYLPPIDGKSALLALYEAEELLNITLKTHFQDYLEDFFKANPADLKEIEKNLLDANLFAIFIKQLGKDFSFEWNNESINRENLDLRSIANLLAAFAAKKIFTQSRSCFNAKMIEKELEKFQNPKEVILKTKKRKKSSQLKIYLSKNKASFFAKAAAGICTAEDIDLWNRKDHFHANLVQGDSIVGNIQLYVIDIEGEKSLLIRGINPSSSFLPEIDVPSLCEGIFKTMKTFAAANRLNKIYLAENGAFHALSNREEVLEYLTPKYCLPEKRKDFIFDITTSASISSVFEVDL